MDFSDVLIEIIGIEADHAGRDRAAEFERRAAALRAGETGRAEYLLNAANSHADSGNYGAAESRCREAIADGGPTVIDARVWLVGVLLAIGKVDDAQRTADAMAPDLAAGNLSPTDVGPLAEAFESEGLLETAHQWLTRAVRDVDPATVTNRDEVIVGLLHDRARVRRAMGLPTDPYDRVSQALAQPSPFRR